MGVPADIFVVLKDRLNEKVGRQMSRVIQFNCLLRAQTRTQGNTDSLKRVADVAVEKAESNGISWPRGNRPIVAKTGRDLAVLPVDIAGTPIEGKSGIQATV